MTANKYPLLFIIISTASIFLFNCSSPTIPTESKPQLSYHFSLPAMNKDSLSITFTCSEPYDKYILPYHYFDNPLDSLPGPLVTGLEITGRSGKRIDTISAVEKVGPVSSIVCMLRENNDYPVTFRYKINTGNIFHDSTTTSMPRIHLDSTLFLIGAYMFIIPYVNQSLVDLWRTPLRIELNCSSPLSLPLYGLSKANTCRNLYELLFVQIKAGAELIASGSGGSFPFVMLDYRERAYDRSIIPALSTSFSNILSDISRRYVWKENYPLAVSFHAFQGGLEGLGGFASIEPSLDTNLANSAVLYHEALHFFIGIHTGEYDDPWWKEGMTSYLGYASSVRIHCWSKRKFRDMVTKSKTDYSNPKLLHALSDPYLRANLFPDTMHALAYEKGLIVSMMLDLRCRQSTNNMVCIDDITAELVNEFDGSAFHRQDFLNAFQRHNIRVEDIFTTYIDKPGPGLNDTLAGKVFDELDSLGAF